MDTKPGATTMAERYRKRPIVIEAVQWDVSKSAWDEIMAMGNIRWNPGPMESESFDIMTVDGNWATIRKGTWVCKGIEGEFYPCQPDIFAKTYEAVTFDPATREELAEALKWYGEQARLCRLIHSEGDAGRHSLSNDGGRRAAAILSRLDAEQNGGAHEKGREI